MNIITNKIMKKIFILFLLLALTSCIQWQNRKDRIINKELTLIVDKQLSNQNLPYMLIKADGRLSGSIGCNRLLGMAYFGNPGEIVFRKVSITKIFCFTDNDFETSFTNGLNKTLYYYIVDDIVYFLDKNKEVVFSLKIKTNNFN